MASWVRTIAPAAPFVVGTGVALLLARPDLPSTAGIIIVGLTVIVLGLELHLRFAAPQLLVAGVLAAVAAGVTLHFATRLNELEDGSKIELGSIADAPQHPNATRFAFPSVRPVSDLDGAAHGILRTHRRSSEYWFSAAMPLVPAGWTRGEPVSAWLVCSDEGKYGGKCSQRFPTSLAAAFIAPQREQRRLRAAVDKAIVAHRLIEAKGAPMLVAAMDIDAETDAMRIWMWCAPLVAFALWLVGWLAFARRRQLRA